jgi:putative tryptophan/tyrosine transport system substrate-binding protein
MRRREFIAGLGGAAASSAIWPLRGGAQQPRMRRIGVLMGYDENDRTAKAYFSGFTQGLAELGWTDGRNMRVDVRWAAANVVRMRTFANELIDLQPDIIVVNSAEATKAVQGQTQTIPVIFLMAGDPVGNGIVGNISRPGGNITGFTYESAIGGKWLELLKEALPRLARVALIFNPELLGGQAYLPLIELAAAQYAVTAIRTPVRNAAAIERAIEAFAGEPNGGLILVPPPLLAAHRELINRLAVQHQLPTIYQDRHFATEGGLMSYGTDIGELFRRGGPSYVDRILRGAKVSELPVQFPTKFELVINQKTAKAMGLEIPPLLLNRADEVIE